ncbi:MAG: hypothetical protein CR974_00055 [Gammaproteobacteria bacterium]|nr:MAG: hypothetical protein CR974_00055 [Gammaproteobacteria bacterium]
MSDYLSRYQDRFQRIYPDYLPYNDEHIGDVYRAVHYSFAAGGKRLRPALVYALADSLGIALSSVDALAVAIECIHTYSLIHDDLPDMDNDDFRRGKPACHKQFNPATAILAGDALNTLAFDILASNTSLSADKRLQQIRQLAQAAGIDGMVGGQDTDMTCENAKRPIELATLTTLHQRKTAKLIEACLLMTYTAGEHVDNDKTTQLSQAALSLGLLYQIQDDILDVTQSSDILGKPAASDLDNAKTTYVSLLGLADAQQAAQRTASDMQQALSDFFTPHCDYQETSLATIVQQIISRQH